MENVEYERLLSFSS